MTLVLPSWDDARAAAYGTGRRLPSETVPFAAADRRVLATDIRSLTALPPRDASAMDGWAVSGAGPWAVGSLVRAGQVHQATLLPGCAVEITTGAAVPAGTTGVLRSEEGRIDHEGRLHGVVTDRQDIRPAGEEATSGQLLISAGTTLSPAHLGLAAAAGHDELDVARRPRAHVLVLGDELLHDGLARHGKVRDSLGAQVPAWLERLGCEVVGVDWVPDTREAHAAGLRSTTAADLVVTSGGTAAGPVDFVRTGLTDAGGALVVEGVDVRPGSPMVLGRWPEGRVLLGLPGNPQAAIAALMTLGVPVIDALVGRPLEMLGTRPLAGHVASRGTGCASSPAHSSTATAHPSSSSAQECSVAWRRRTASRWCPEVGPPRATRCAGCRCPDVTRSGTTRRRVPRCVGTRRPGRHRRRRRPRGGTS